MSDAFLFSVAQFLYFLWPVFIAATLVYSLQGRARLRVILRRARHDLLITWSLLFAVWVFTFFAPGPNVTILPEPINTPVFLGGLALLFFGEFGPRLHNGLHARVDLHRTHALSDLKRMDPYHFEELVTETYRSLGYKAEHVGHSGDHGVDVRLRSPAGELIVVQCKRYHGTVGESIVRDLYGTMFSEGAKRAILVTTADVTPPAEAWARDKPITLIDGPALLNLLEDARRRREGTLVDRLARWLAARFTPSAADLPMMRNRPAAAVYDDAPTSRTQPIRARQGDLHAPLNAGPHHPHQSPTHSDPAVTMRSGSAAPTRGEPPAPTRSDRAAPPRSDRAAPATSDQAHLLSVDEFLAPARNGHEAGGLSDTQAAHPQPGRALAPTCPACGAPMLRRPPRPGERPMRVFYRCSRYPNCRAVVEG